MSVIYKNVGFLACNVGYNVVFDVRPLLLHGHVVEIITATLRILQARLYCHSNVFYLQWHCRIFVLLLREEVSYGAPRPL